MNKSQLGAALLFSAILASRVTAAEKELKTVARDVLANNKAAVVSVKLVVTTRTVDSGKQVDKSDAKHEVTGTIVDPSGLTVISASVLDAQEEMQMIFIGGGGEETDGEKTDVKPEATVSDVKIVLADGTEVPAEVVLKEKDLDLAFIKPKQKLAAPAPFIKFEKTAEPDLLDDTISIKRLDASLNREKSVALGKVLSVVKKPRTFFVCDCEFFDLASPVFNSNGAALGILLERKNPVKAGEHNLFDVEMTYVVLPGEDIADASRQALAQAAKKE